MRIFAGPILCVRNLSSSPFSFLPSLSGLRTQVPSFLLIALVQPTHRPPECDVTPGYLAPASVNASHYPKTVFRHFQLLFDIEKWELSQNFVSFSKSDPPRNGPASRPTMDDERERQQHDLQRATKLLETMSREELVDMLHDILFNERSDDTRKLSDWMAFQIIIQDETRDARKLLAQLGKVSATRLHVLRGRGQAH